MPRYSLLLPAVVAALWVESSSAHGVMTNPKSRNLYAFETGRLSSFYDATALNNNLYITDFRSSSVCGQVQEGGDDALDFDTFLAGDLGQDHVFEAGSTITVDVTLTVYHFGHFEFSLCPVNGGSLTPSQNCFRNNKLEIVRDNIHMAPLDPNHPERAMIPPRNFGMDYSYEVALPDNLVQGNYVLKWMYVTGNSCHADGYEEYPIPSSWGSMYNVGLQSCEAYDLPTPLAAPEIFINCADIMIVGSTEGRISPPEVEQPIAKPTPTTTQTNNEIVPPIVDEVAMPTNEQPPTGTIIEPPPVMNEEPGPVEELPSNNVDTQQTEEPVSEETEEPVSEETEEPVSEETEGPVSEETEDPVPSDENTGSGRFQWTMVVA